MRFLIAFLKETELIEIRERVSDCRDENDNKFLELALSGKADCIISGDDDLLVLNPYRGVSIINPRDFLAGISKW
ncbi:MAG: PilT protein domain protein [Acidobacteria bacterium]|nr:PilT protein domain protein [Acidobacteriota bacterium]